ncbi:MAG: enoyl-CoA hydratase-related protein [Chitinophagales bacterium]|nr:enoyl-CoA hydratase-related protein [Chitinophagales bacterium]MDW8418114.1 enoyl-CoA hydratase-related protein [Chitinophagales bacterium]
MYNTVLYNTENGICTITLNRPEVFNSFNEELSAEFIDALKKAGKDEAVRVVVITGAGKAFCSGQDLKDIKGEVGKRSLGDSVLRRYNPMILAIREMPKPVICRLNGVAAGAGASLALACDIIIAAENATLIEVFANVGLVPDSGSSFFLPRLVGYQKAFEWITLTTRISAAEAQQWGIVYQVVPPDTLDAAVAELANRYAQGPTKAYALTKKLLNKAYTASLTEMLTQEYYGQEIAGRSEDYAEGVRAFIEKRPAVFKGK